MVQVQVQKVTSRVQVQVLPCGTRAVYEYKSEYSISVLEYGFKYRAPGLKYFISDDEQTENPCQ